MADESALAFMHDSWQPNDDQRIERLAKHMSEMPELPALVLTGHLLLEEMLSEILAEWFQHAELVESTRLSFAQKLELCRAASWDQQDNKAWDLLKALNTVRNELAHRLESPKLDAKLAQLRALYLLRYPEGAQESDEAVVRSCVAHAAGFLAECVVEAFELRKMLNSAVKRLLAKADRGPAA